MTDQHDELEGYDRPYLERLLLATDGLVKNSSMSRLSEQLFGALDFELLEAGSGAGPFVVGEQVLDLLQTLVQELGVGLIQKRGGLALASQQPADEVNRKPLSGRGGPGGLEVEEQLGTVAGELETQLAGLDREQSVAAVGRSNHGSRDPEPGVRPEESHVSGDERQDPRHARHISRTRGSPRRRLSGRARPIR